ncbi:MAG: hypothetical protein ACYCZJ_13520 [Sulfuriferula sp.]
MKRKWRVVVINCALLSGMLIMFGCSEPKDMNRIEKIVLHDSNTTATLSIPAAYGAKAFSKNTGLEFHCLYPGMQPVGNKSYEDEMTVFILLGRFRKNLEELKIEEAQSDHFDPKRPGAVYRAGTHDVYEIFLRGDRINDPQGMQTYYLFKAHDDQWVQVEWGEHDAIYSAERQISPDISIQYNFPKQKGTDFIHIDEVVMGFIKNHFTSHFVSH